MAGGASTEREPDAPKGTPLPTTTTAPIPGPIDLSLCDNHRNRLSGQAPADRHPEDAAPSHLSHAGNSITNRSTGQGQNGLLVPTTKHASIAGHIDPTRSKRTSH